MKDFDIILSLNNSQFTAKIHPYINGEKTFYDVPFDNYTITIYKDTLYTWTSDDANGLSKADIQSIGEQIENV